MYVFIYYERQGDDAILKIQEVIYNYIQIKQHTQRQTQMNQVQIPEESIKVVDMQKQMIVQAVRVAKQALQKFQIYRDVAKYIKDYFDEIYYPNWHCFVGKSFSTVVTYESRHYIHFQMAQTSILLFKFG